MSNRMATVEPHESESKTKRAITQAPHDASLQNHIIGVLAPPPPRHCLLHLCKRTMPKLGFAWHSSFISAELIANHRAL